MSWLSDRIERSRILRSAQWDKISADKTCHEVLILRFGPNEIRFGWKAGSLPNGTDTTKSMVFEKLDHPDFLFIVSNSRRIEDSKLARRVFSVLMRRMDPSGLTRMLYLLLREEPAA